MKVLLISHTCMSRTAGQPKLHCLASYPDIELTALVPDRFFSYGKWSAAESPENPAFRYLIGRARWQNIRNQWYLLNYAEGIGRALQESQPDVVDIWEEPWSLTSAQAISITRRLAPKARIIVETEQNIYKKLPAPFLQFQRYSLRHADFMVARNQEAVGVLRRKGYAGLARVVPNAVDCDLFHPLADAERLAERAKLGWNDSSLFIVGYVGRLVPEKGLAGVVEAFAQLPENCRLLFVGEGPMRAELEALTQSLGVDRRTVFTGNRPLMELPALMNTMNVLLLPSLTTARWKEQFGRVLIEAGACRVAVIGSDSGAIPEVVAEGGLIFPEGDVSALADSLRILLEDPARCARCADNGYERAHTLYSWRCVAAQMRDIYQEVLGSAAK